MSEGTDRVLVVYFSHSGNTREIAELIHGLVPSDIFEIVPVDAYPRDYDSVVDQAGRERKADYRPKLGARVANMAAYRTVIVGYPNWWGTMPMALFTFLEAHDLVDKTIAPFCTHEGSGLGRSVSDIARLCPKSTVLDGLALRGSAVRAATPVVSRWLRQLGLIR